MFPHLFALILALLTYQKPEKTKVKVLKIKTKCHIWNTIQNAPKCCICKCNGNVLYILSYWVKYILFGMKWKVSFSTVVCENICYYRPSAAEKRIKKQNAESGLKSNKYWGKKPELHWNFIRMEDYTMHKTLKACMFGYHFLSYSVCLFKILKQKNHS